MKKLYAGVVVAVLVLFGATVQSVLGAAAQPGSKILDYPHATNLNDTDWFPVSQSGVTKSMSGALLRSVTTNLAGQIITNLTVIKTQFVNVSIITNLTVIQTNTANYTIVTNLTVINTNTVNYEIVTNLTVVTTEIVNNEIVTNVTVINDFRGSRFSTFNTFLVTNGLSDAQTNMDATATTNQVDFGAGPQSYYWTNMVTNIVCQLTNVWGGGVSNRTYKFEFEGGALDYTVTFLVPNPDGVVLHWGVFVPTNGLTSFTVTNGHSASASLTLWRSNRIEAFYSPGI